jgi:hypothetical protein
METWKYNVPFSSHCCLQCTIEMSAAVPDISARQEPRYWVSYMPGSGALGRIGVIQSHGIYLCQDAFPYTSSMSQGSSRSFINGTSVAKIFPKWKRGRSKIWT